MRIFFELKNYFINTDTNKQSFNTPVEKRKSFLQVFLVYFLIVLTLSIITGMIRIMFNISFAPHNINIPVFLIINIFVFPIMEETAFRLPLIYKRLNLSLSVLLLFYYIISIVLVGDVINISNRIIIRIGLSVFFAVFAYVILGIKIVGLKVMKFWGNYYKIIFYVFLLLFTFRHLDSYLLTPVILLFSPILLLPQFIGGVFFSFTRIKFGFVYAILLHMMINLTAFIPQLIIL